MKKTLIVRTAFIVLALVMCAVAAINIQAMQQVRRVTEILGPEDKMEASLKNYETGETIQVTEASDLEEICDSLAALKYGGLYLGRKFGKSWVQPGDQAYSLIVSTGEFQEVLILYAPHDQSYIVWEPLNITLKNTDALYETIWSFFK